MAENGIEKGADGVVGTVEVEELERKNWWVVKVVGKVVGRSCHNWEVVVVGHPVY